MIVTTSNLLLDFDPSLITITEGANSAPNYPANLIDPDFSTLYLSSSNIRLTAEFGVFPSINYVAVAGINIASTVLDSSLDDNLARVRVYDGQTLIKTNQVIRNNCVVILFDQRSFTNLRISLRTPFGVNPICTFMAAGQAIEIPNNGEQAGYNRQFLNRSFTQKTTTNNIAAPTSVLTKKIPAKGVLSMPNLTQEFTQDTWQTFLDFAVNNYFFIQEQQIDNDSTTTGINSSSYLCYNLSSNKVTAHSQTRKLNDSSISFSVFNGL